MSEALKEIHAPYYLSQERKLQSRSLYEMIFTEDAGRFTDYYYTYKIRDNEILALEEDGQIVSMLHLNPYRMIVNGYEIRSSCIAAVATHEAYRGRGYMRILLERALRDQEAKRTPFVFLMPVSEGIYTPYDFARLSPYTELPARVARMGMEEQNRWLASRYQLFCKRDERYMENLRAQEIAEEGEPPEDRPLPYMARITDVCQVLRLVGSRSARKLYLHVKDTVIDKNDGYFLWEMSSKEQISAEKLDEKPRRLDMELTVGELVSILFGGFRCCLSELV